MKTNIQSITKLIESNRQFIAEFPLENNIGTKKMIKKYHEEAIIKKNEFVSEEITLFTQYKELLFKTIKEKSNTMLPRDDTKDLISLKNQGILIQKTILSLDKSNTADKLGLNEIICELKDNENIDLDTVNNLLLMFINKFRQMNIILTNYDFNYSVATYLYMKDFFKFMNDSTFCEKMKNTFESIYWECPSLIIHLKLNMKYIVTLYTKELKSYEEELKNKLLLQTNLNEENCLTAYNDVMINMDYLIKTNDYLNLNKFLTNELAIADYIEDSSNRKNVFNRFLDKDVNFANLNQVEIDKFYSDIISLDKILEELENYYYFESIIQDIIKRYMKKDSYKGVYQNKTKEVDKEEKIREKLVYAYEKAQRPSIFSKKVQPNEIKESINLQIDKLSKLYDELEDNLINEKILINLDDKATLDDVIKLCNSSYVYLRTLFKLENPKSNQSQVTKFINDFTDFCFNPNNTFTKKVNILNTQNITKLICDKYYLFNINFDILDLNKENLSKLHQDVKMIATIYYMSKGHITFDNINFICTVNKLN